MILNTAISIHGDSKFVVNSRLDVKVGLDGVQVLGASASEWVNGGIRVIPGEKGKMQSSYPLYANLEKAQENSLSEVPTTTLSLSAETLPDVQAGSVVLYRKFRRRRDHRRQTAQGCISISICISSRSTATC